MYEGGIRVPFLVSWPGHIKAGRESDHIGAFWDMFPTFLDIAGIEAQPYQIDGISLYPELMGKRNQKDHEYLYWEFHEQGGRVAILQYPWKGIRYGVNQDPDSPLELYNLISDPGEENNVAAEQPELIERFNRLLKEARVASETFTSKGLDR